MTGFTRFVENQIGTFYYKKVKQWRVKPRGPKTYCKVGKWEKHPRKNQLIYTALEKWDVTGGERIQKMGVSQFESLRGKRLKWKSTTSSNKNLMEVTSLLCAKMRKGYRKKNCWGTFWRTKANVLTIEKGITKRTPDDGPVTVKQMLVKYRWSNGWSFSKPE